VPPDCRVAWPKVSKKIDMTHPYRIPFGEMAGASPAQFMSAKAATVGSHRLRLVEFHKGFQEVDWCRQSHAGYVLEGRLHVAFPTQELTVETGDGLYIPWGDAHRHKVTPLTERVLVVFFDPT
jgi:quercetin dioxygenase-like cupin family protein